MTVGVEEKACMMLESLACHLSDGHVDYECFQGEHKFVITTRAGGRLIVRIADHKLLRKRLDELETTVHQILRQVGKVTSLPQTSP